MANLTKAQIAKIKKIITEHMEVLMKIVVGDGKPSPELIRKLGLPKEITDLITDSYKYGKLGVLRGKDLSKMSQSEVEKLLKKLTLTKHQQKAVEYLQIKTQQSIDTLHAKVLANVMNTVVQDQLNMYETVKKVVPDAVADHTERYKVIQQLREQSGDWARDWHRVAHTEMWDAKVMGEANAIIDNESPVSKKGSETLVFKRPGPNACAQCKKHYLESDGITPKVFRLSDLMANGTNYGKKTADWKPTVGILHPNCLCPLSVMPDGYTFDATGQLVPKSEK